MITLQSPEACRAVDTITTEYMNYLKDRIIDYSITGVSPEHNIVLEVRRNTLVSAEQNFIRIVNKVVSDLTNIPHKE